jgi:hypothetical protein
VRRCAPLLFGALSLAACGRLGFGASDEPVIDAAGLADADRIVDGAPVIDGAAGVDADPHALGRAFVTVATYAADLGSSAAADAICQDAADGASLGGAFVALLADSSRDHLDALAGSRGWVDLNGLPIADVPSDWVDGRMRFPLRRTEAGTLVTGRVWFGSDVMNCGDWTIGGNVPAGATGQASSANLLTPTTPCNDPAHLFCVEVGRTEPLPPIDESGRYIFVSTATWQPGGGLASADALCAGEAASASLPGTYLAVLGSSAGGPLARFDIGGAPWRRVDGVRVAATAAAFAAQPAGDVYPSFVNLDAAGVPRTYVGSHVGSAAAHCQDWTSADPGQSAPSGLFSDAAVDTFWTYGQAACDRTARILCAQE